MGKNEEESVEKPLIEQLKKLGYSHLTSKELKRERSSVILESRLRDALKRLNPWISENNLDKVIREISLPKPDGTWSLNKKMYNYLFEDGLSVPQDLGKGNKNQTIRLFDFENPKSKANDYLVVSQFTVQNPKGEIRPDIVIFVNGLPLVMIECKSPLLEADRQIPEAVHQMQRYLETDDRIFYYNQLMIATSFHRAKVGTLFAKTEHYSTWKDPYPLKLSDFPKDFQQPILAAGILRKEVLLDMCRNFIVFDGKVKKFARYQQYRAVEKAIERIEGTNEPRLRGGVVWHTQGSGKSLTMVYLAKKLRRLKELANPMIVVVTDREDLDQQIKDTFQDSGFPNPIKVKSMLDLKDKLAKGPGTTVTTLIQKFQTKEKEIFPIISDDKNIIVMTDESHRSQYKNWAMNMRTALPNATFIGFTGTPIDKEIRSTTATFGSYIDKYTIDQAVKDGATVPILYEARLTNVHLSGESLDAIFSRSFYEFEEADQQRIQNKYVNRELLITSPERMRDVALDIVLHFEEHFLINGFKAQVVAVNRWAACKYKELIDQFSQGRFETAVIVSSQQNETDQLLKKYGSKTKQEEKLLINRFKKPFDQDKLAILIVCDKLLTGFDAPIEQVMYLDKPLREHNLLQAIARTNRRYDEGNQHKTYGLIVDYLGISKFLDEALANFSSSDIEGALTSIEEEIPHLEKRHRAVMNYFYGVRREDIEKATLCLKEENIRAEFNAKYKKFAQSMDSVMPSPKAQPFLDDFNWVSMIRLNARSLYSDDDNQVDISDCGEKVRQIVHDYLHTNGIDVHPPVSLLSDRFEAEIEELESLESKAAKIEHAIKKEISFLLEEDVVFYTSISEKVQQLIDQLETEQLSLFDFNNEMMEQRELIKEKNDGKTQSGLEAKVEPYYNRLVETCGEINSDKELREIAIGIQNMIYDKVSVIPDWTKKIDFKRELANDILMYLINQKLEFSIADTLTGYFSQQAENQYEN